MNFYYNFEHLRFSKNQIRKYENLIFIYNNEIKFKILEYEFKFFL